MTTRTVLSALLVLAGVTAPAVRSACADSSGELKHPDWHPAGRLLVAEGSCAGGTDLYLVDTVTGHGSRLWDGGATEGYPRWFPRGDRIAFHQIDGDRKSRILIANLDDNMTVSNVRVLTEGPFDIEPAPSPDGLRIAHTRAGPTSLDLALVDAESGKAIATWETDDAENFPSWYPDGVSIIFHARDAASTRIWRLDLDTGARSLRVPDSGPNLVGNLDSRGDRMVYSSERDGDREVYLRDIASGSERRLTVRPGRDGYPKFSPGGKRIAYHAVIDGTSTVIRVLNLDSGEMTQFSCEGLVSEPVGSAVLE